MKGPAFYRKIKPQGGEKKMKKSMIDAMLKAGATENEAERAAALFEFLRPGLKVMRNGRIMTTYGDKTPLGLYRTIQHNI
jgi:hypothetical protein